LQNRSLSQISLHFCNQFFPVKTQGQIPFALTKGVLFFARQFLMVAGIRLGNIQHSL
jgi:hypothetical protein